MSHTTQEIHAKANSFNVMTYNSMKITTLTMKKDNIRREFCIHLKNGKIRVSIHVRMSELCDNRSTTPATTYGIQKLTLPKTHSITQCSITLQKKSEKILTKQRKDFTLLGCYTAYVGSDLPTFHDSLSFPCSMVTQTKRNSTWAASHPRRRKA